MPTITIAVSVNSTDRCTHILPVSNRKDVKQQMGGILAITASCSSVWTCQGGELTLQVAGQTDMVLKR